MILQRSKMISRTIFRDQKQLQRWIITKRIEKLSSVSLSNFRDGNELRRKNNSWDKMQLQKIINSQMKLGFQIKSNLDIRSEFKDQSDFRLANYMSEITSFFFNLGLILILSWNWTLLNFTTSQFPWTVEFPKQKMA